MPTVFWVLGHITDPSELYKLLIQLLYGNGLRLSEGLQLRIKDVDFAQCQLHIRDAKGRESRMTMLLAQVLEPLQVHLQQVRHLHNQDLGRSYGSVYPPFALERKYPNSDCLVC